MCDEKRLQGQAASKRDLGPRQPHTNRCLGLLSNSPRINKRHSVATTAAAEQLAGMELNLPMGKATYPPRRDLRTPAYHLRNTTC